MIVCSGLTIRVFLGERCLSDRVVAMTRVQRAVTVSATCVTSAYEQWRAELDEYQWRAYCLSLQRKTILQMAFTPLAFAPRLMFSCFKIIL